MNFVRKRIQNSNQGFHPQRKYLPCVQRLVNDANSNVFSWKKNLKNTCIVFKIPHFSLIVNQLFQQIMMLQAARNIHLI